MPLPRYKKRLSLTFFRSLLVAAIFLYALGRVLLVNPPPHTRRPFFFYQLTNLESELNALDTRGYSVLHYTCLHNLGSLVPVLIDRGADVNLRTGDGQLQVTINEGRYVYIYIYMCSSRGRESSI